MTRFPDWQSRLDQYLCASRSRIFGYGAFDCCLFVCDAILAITGADLASDYRNRYTTRREARMLIHKHTGSPSVQAVAHAAAREYGLPEIRPMQAQRGDMLLLQRPNDYSLAIVGLDGAYLAAAANGYERVPAHFAVRAWHV